MSTTPEQITDLTKAHIDAHQDLLNFSSSLDSRVTAKEQQIDNSIQNFNSLIPKVSAHTYYPPEWSYSTTNTNHDMDGDVGLLYSVDFSVPRKSIIIANLVGHWTGPSTRWTIFSMSINGQGGNYSQQEAQNGHEQELGKKWRHLHHSIMKEVPAGPVKIGVHLSSANGDASINGSSVSYTIIEIGEQS